MKLVKVNGWVDVTDQDVVNQAKAVGIAYEEEVVPREYYINPDNVDLFFDVPEPDVSPWADHEVTIRTTGGWYFRIGGTAEELRRKMENTE